MAEIQGVFLPELQSEVVDGLIIPFAVFIWTCVLLVFDLDLELAASFPIEPLLVGELETCDR